MKRGTTSAIIGSIDNLVLAVYSCEFLKRSFRVLFRLLPHVDITVRLAEGKVHTDSPDRLIAALLWKYKAKGSAEYAVYRSAIKPGMTVLDIGANIGTLTILFSSLAGAAGKVVAVEPDPDNFRLLRKNVEENGCSNVQCRNLAAADSDGTLRLFRSEEHHGDHRIYDSGDGRASVEVGRSSVDNMLGDGAAADFVKMDVQGAEMLALKGMERTLRNSPDVTVLCEFSPSLLRKAGSGPDELLKKFSDLGFAINYIDESSGAAVPASTAELIAMCPGDKYLNLLLARKPLSSAS